MEQEQLVYQNIGLNEMAAFMRWLQNPYGNAKVSPIGSVSSTRTARVVKRYKALVEGRHAPGGYGNTSIYLSWIEF